MMKTLLISDTPPSTKSSGTLLTWHLCKNFSADNLVGYFLVSRGLEWLTMELPFQRAIPHKLLTKYYDGSFRPTWLPKKMRLIAAFVRELYRKYVEAPRYLKDILKFAEEHQVDRIWIILQGQTMIWLSEGLIRKKKIPVHVQVWDSPNWWIKANYIDRFSAKMLKKSYTFSVANASHFASASFPMALEYTQRYAKLSQVLIGTIPSSYIIEESKAKNKDRFVIGIAGQIYAEDTFSGLVEALDSIYWELDGRKVEIHFWGNAQPPEQRTRIVRKGYVSQDQLTFELSACDLLYCPYWFDVRFREEAETSFPSKLITYLAANTVVMFHGPTYSSPVQVLKEANAAICCVSNHPESILMHLREVMYSPNRDEIIRNAKHLLQGKLGESYLHSSFKQFMDFSETK